MMDQNNTYEKITDSNTIRMPDGREIMVFTIQRESLWFCIVYDRARNVMLKTPFLDYQKAFNNFVIICKLLDCESKDVEKSQGDIFWKLIWVGIAIMFVAWAISR